MRMRGGVAEEVEAFKRRLNGVTVTVAKSIAPICCIAALDLTDLARS